MTAAGDVEYGAHLPLIELGASRSLPALKAYVRAAAGLGYRHLCANDHLVFGRPWLDGPTALAAVVEESRDMTLATTASLPVLRGPVQLAKTLAAVDVLSGGRLVVGVAPGSSARDYDAVGLRFQERWRRFDEAVRVLRVLLHGDAAGFEGEFYATRGVVLAPRPVQRPGPPIWIASWGSPAGLRRVARHGDGWLASAYNTTPDRFREGLDRLAGELRLVGKPRSRSRARSPRPGCTSPRTGPWRSGCAASCSRPCCAARPRCCGPSRCWSAPRRRARSACPHWCPRARGGSSSGRSATRCASSRCSASGSPPGPAVAAPLSPRTRRRRGSRTGSRSASGEPGRRT